MWITYKKISRPFECVNYEVRIRRKTVARLSVSGSRYYWYRLNRRPNDPPHNTLCVPGSATTLLGCKAEIKEFFNERQTETT